MVYFLVRELRILKKKGYSITFIDYIDIQTARVGGERIVRLHCFAFEYKIILSFSYIKASFVVLGFLSSIKALTFCIFWMEIINVTLHLGVLQNPLNRNPSTEFCRCYPVLVKN